MTHRERVSHIPPHYKTYKALLPQLEEYLRSLLTLKFFLWVYGVRPIGHLVTPQRVSGLAKMSTFQHD